MAHSFSKLLYHAIFSTKNREPLLDANLKPRMLPYLGGIVRNLPGAALAINGTRDHVHLLLSLPATLGIAEAIRVIKTNSSKWAHEELHLPGFGWQTGYGAFTVSYSGKGRVALYIDNQEEHHKMTSFQDEFITFLKRHEIEYDERYIWE